MAFVEDNATMSSIQYFENHVTYFMQNTDGKKVYQVQNGLTSGEWVGRKSLDQIHLLITNDSHQCYSICGV